MAPEICVTAEIDDPAATVRAGLRGLVAAMAMTGLRTFTGNVGLLQESPPEAIAEEHAPDAFHRLAAEYRTALTELAHWAYGTAGGVVFSFLPARVRAHPLTGPAYGLAVWMTFEAGLAPLLRRRHAEAQRPVSRAVLALDHVLYGIVVAGRLAPEHRLSGRGRPSGPGSPSDPASCAGRPRRHPAPAGRSQRR